MNCLTLLHNYSIENMAKHLQRVWILLAIITSVCLESCHNENDPAPPPAITSITPVGGIATMDVTIAGSNFDTKASANTVKFNGVAAEVKSATAKELVVTVPEGTTGPISVTTSGGVIDGPTFRFYEIYLLATDLRPGKTTIKWWQNGKLDSISDVTNSTSASAMVVSGNDFYVAGNVYQNFRLIPTYWNNKVPYPLTNGTMGNAEDIAVVGSDVYVAGIEYNGSNWMAKYWKNGAGVGLTASTTFNTDVSAIAVSNGDIYVGGYVGVSDTQGVATIWKNGAGTVISAPNDAEVITDIIVNGADVHVLSRRSHPTTALNMIMYRKNGVLRQVTDGTRQAVAYAMTLAGNDVLLTGYENNDRGIAVAKIWTNDKVITLSDGTTRTVLVGSAVLGDDLVVAGFFVIGTKTIPFYAINNKVFQLSEGTGHYSVTSMFAR